MENLVIIYLCDNFQIYIYMILDGTTYIPAGMNDTQAGPLIYKNEKTKT